MDLRDQLQATLGSAYTLERELGGGGMSRVFVATETALGRKVVVKVLAPELTHGVSVERFRREIQLAAQLQHPHIVPVHTSGETGGLPFYTMPFVEGATLRSRLARAGALPLAEAINVLREVAKALAYAHERGVAHRDIKPDNVLITGGTAVVTDFGIAKALAAARHAGTDDGVNAPTESALTALGTSIGTPAYMAPEQAAADPATDHRADIYSFGCVAYELLAGRPPFAGKTPQRLLAAHMGEKPQPITELRADAPSLLGELVMRCLEKDPDSRPQSALDLVKVLESVTTSGGAHPAMPAILLGGRPRLARALAMYTVAFVAIVILAKAAIVGIGLPTWVLPGVVVVMALGLPVILFTAFVHHGAHQAMTMAHLTPGGSPLAQSTLTRLAVRASPWVNWRRTTFGGFAALGVLVLLVIGYMVTRAFGIGPAASLMGAGVLGAKEKLIIADFKSPANDTTLGPVVTEAFRSDLAQSANLDVVPQTTVREVLRRMQRPADARLDYALGREIATREGVKAVIDGEVLSLGGSYVIAAKLYAAQTGDVLGSFRATAEQAKDIIPAIDQLSREVRTKVGESLRNINAAPPLQQVTTPSLEALKKYVQGVRVFAEAADFDKGVSLMEEAIALDTGFAMAYRKLGIELGNHGGMTARQVDLIRKAYDHRARLSEPERYLTEATYWGNGPHQDAMKAIAAYEALLELQPDNTTALNNVALQYILVRQFAKAEVAARRAVTVNPNANPYWRNLINAQVDQGKLSDAEKSLEEFGRHLPGSVRVPDARMRLAWARERFDSVSAMLAGIAKSGRTESNLRRVTAQWAAALADLHGQLREARTASASLAAVERAQGVTTAPLTEMLGAARSAIWFRGDTARAIHVLDSALQVMPLDKIDPLDRPYGDLVELFALTGQTARARKMASAFEESRKSNSIFGDETTRQEMAGALAMAERHFPDAVRAFASANDPCEPCQDARLAQAYDLAGNADSAVAVLTRYVAPRSPSLRSDADAFYLAGSYKRLGELWEQKGDRQRAASYYSKFVTLWKDADPELQPKVAEVQKRLARLGDTEARR